MSNKNATISAAVPAAVKSDAAVAAAHGMSLAALARELLVARFAARDTETLA